VPFVAAISPALASDADLSFAAILTVLLVLTLVAVFRSPSWTGRAPDDEPDNEPDRREPDDEPPTAPLPRRIAGQSGWVAPLAGAPVHPLGVIQEPGVSGGPPWEPAPKPPGGP
jgi:hypothetical protein